MTVGLQRDVARIQGVCFPLNKGLAEFVPGIILRIGKFEDFLTVDPVTDLAITDVNLGSNPLIAVKSAGYSWGRAKASIQAVADLYFGANGTNLPDGPLICPISAVEVVLQANGEILILAHGLWGLTMILNPAIPKSPGGGTGGGFAYKTIFDFEAIVSKWRIIDEGTEFGVIAFIAIIADFQYTVFHPYRIGVIIAQFVAIDFDSPAVEVFAIE